MYEISLQYEFFNVFENDLSVQKLLPQWLHIYGFSLKQVHVSENYWDEQRIYHIDLIHRVSHQCDLFPVFEDDQDMQCKALSPWLYL